MTSEFFCFFFQSGKGGLLGLYCGLKGFLALVLNISESPSRNPKRCFAALNYCVNRIACFNNTSITNSVNNKENLRIVDLFKEIFVKEIARYVRSHPNGRMPRVNVGGRVERGAVRSIIGGETLSILRDQSTGVTNVNLTVCLADSHVVLDAARVKARILFCRVENHQLC